ncbi:MAG TPA: universal stress protein [Thermodesulfobacteriota bacterium]|nr:universal stress protein [Thermodesulfobacteriota bacterium]
MIKKILWATDGSKDSDETLRYVEILAGKYKSEIVGLYVIPDYPERRVADQFSSEDKTRFLKWVEENESKERMRLEQIAKDLKKKGINFRGEIGLGIPRKEILKVAEEEGVNLIALGKGRPIEKFILGGTAVKVLRQSSFPVLTAKEGGKSVGIKRILAPVDIAHAFPKSLSYAVELSREFDAEVYLLSIVEVGEYDFPIEMVERMRGFSIREIEENIGKSRIGKNVETHVEVAKNAWRGIVKFAQEKNIDLIVMMTYGGVKFKEDFIGSTAERVVQEARCPVITMKP